MVPGKYVCGMTRVLKTGLILEAVFVLCKAAWNLS